jgi:hypothetical protein
MSLTDVMINVMSDDRCDDECGDDVVFMTEIAGTQT